MAEPFIAEIRIFAGNFAPRGWSFCDGQLLPISQNTALFSLIGTTYGGDGESTTALPNLKGRAAMHPGRGPGLTSRRLGERGGTETETLSEAQMPNHTHAMQASSEQASVSSPVGAVLAATPASKMPYATANNLVSMDLGGLETKGGGQPHNNMQPYLAINFIIALTGTYPSRA